MTAMECFAALQGIHIVLIVGILLLLAGYIYLVVKVTQLEFVGGLVGKCKIRVFGILFGSLVVVYLLYNLHNIQPNQWVEISLLAGLVGATGLLALVTLQQAHTTAKEMKEQRIIASRPLIILKSVHEKDIYEGSTKDYFSHFEISNVGNSPAIEVESSLTVNKRDYSDSIRQTYLRKDDPPIKFRPYGIANLEENRTYYLICDYQNIFSYGAQKPLYQTCLPFKISKSSDEGKIYMIAGELEVKEVSEEERIDAFGSRSKPK